MNYEKDIQEFEARIAHDKRLLSACQRDELAPGAEKEQNAKEIEKLKEGIASLEQVVAWLRYKSSAE